MKNLLNLVIRKVSNMTLKQQLILIGFTILPGASLILIFSLFVQQIIQKPAKMKITRIYGNKFKQQKEDLK
jgi:hypothetical protein